LAEPKAQAVALEWAGASLRGCTISATHSAGTILFVNSDRQKLLTSAAVE
jgi:hypothetical protein